MNHKSEDQLFKYIKYCTEDGRIFYKDGKKAKQWKNNSKYLYISKWINKKNYSALSHRIIWRYFNGKIPDGLQINHLNLKKDDNKLKNLELVTPKENMRHAVNAGVKFGSSQNNFGYLKYKKLGSKLHFDDIKKIKQRLKDGENTKIIAKDYNVKYQTIQNIKMKRSWADVKIED